jgi:putative DNA primase/helicase
VIPIRELLARLEDVDPPFQTEPEGPWKARCPLHNDRERSLRISAQSDRILMVCVRRCDSEQIRHALATPAATAAAVKSTTMLDAALEHAQRGPIFPVWHAESGGCGCRAYDCTSPGKHPISSCAPNGLKNATTDEATIRQWWEMFPRANIGRPTGGDFNVLDVDPHHGGRESLAQLEAQHAPLPVTAKVLTGGGGEHYHFAAVPGLKNSVGKLSPGLDIRAEGGYVLLPPSNHVSGNTYLDDLLAPMYETALAPMPAWLVALAMAPASGSNSNGPRRAPDEWAEKLIGAPLGQRRGVALEIAGHYLGLRIAPEEVEAIVLGYAARCVPPFPDREARGLVRDLARRDHARRQAGTVVAAPRGESTPDASWPPPEPVPTALSPVPPFDVGRLLPDAVASWVDDVAERAQCPPDFVAVAVMVAAAAIVGRQLTIRPKTHDDWGVVPNIWGLVVGRPGLMKTAAMQEALRGVHRLIGEAREAYQQAVGKHEFQVAEAEARRSAVEKQLKIAVANGAPTDELRAAFEASRAPDAPVERRYLVNDATVEKLGALLNLHPNGLLLFRDELAGFLRTMEREGHENDRAFYCEAWNGNGSYTYDRIGRGTLHISAACVSILGGIQPLPLAAYLSEAFGRGQDDGLIQRFQLMVYPDVSPMWRNVDRWPDTDARRRVVEIFQALDRLDYEALAAHQEGLERPFLRFAPEAQARFDPWRAELEHRIRGGDEHPIFGSHLAKYRSLCPSLALLFHLIDCVDRGAGGPVSVAAVQRAIDWCAYLEPHARRLYEGVISPGRTAAAALAARLAAGALKSPFTVRDVRRKGWAGLTTPESIFAAVDQLEDLHWIRRASVHSAAGGRPTTQYHVNPAAVEARQ